MMLRKTQNERKRALDILTDDFNLLKKQFANFCQTSSQIQSMSTDKNHDKLQQLKIDKVIYGDYKCFSFKTQNKNKSFTFKPRQYEKSKTVPSVQQILTQRVAKDSNQMQSQNNQQDRHIQFQIQKSNNFNYRLTNSVNHTQKSVEKNRIKTEDHQINQLESISLELFYKTLKNRTEFYLQKIKMLQSNIQEKQSIIEGLNKQIQYLMKQSNDIQQLSLKSSLLNNNQVSILQELLLTKKQLQIEKQRHFQREKQLLTQLENIKIRKDQIKEQKKMESLQNQTIIQIKQEKYQFTNKSDNSYKDLQKRKKLTLNEIKRKHQIQKQQRQKQSNIKLQIPSTKKNELAICQEL